MLKEDISLIIFTQLKGYGKVAILQARGEFNHERMNPETYPGGTQSTVHGGLEQNETYIQALLRETEEELGEKVAQLIKSRLKDLKEVYHKGVKIEIKTQTRKVKTYAIYIEDPSFIKDIRLSASSGGIRIVTKKDLKNLRSIYEHVKEPRFNGVDERRVIAMFPDELAALKSAFKKILK